QVLINVRVCERRDLATVEPVAQAIQRVTQALGNKGRLMVRYSGTEPLVRVMVEGEDEHVVRGYGEEVAEAVREHIGVKRGTDSATSPFDKLRANGPGLAVIDNLPFRLSPSKPAPPRPLPRGGRDCSRMYLVTAAEMRELDRLTI